MKRSGLRDECLSETLFTPMLEAPAVLATWRRDDNTIRSHSKLGGRPPGQRAFWEFPGYRNCVSRLLYRPPPFERIML
jgi:hypothetical protein